MQFFFLLLLMVFSYPSMVYAQCSFIVEDENLVSNPFYCFEATANLNYTLTGTPVGGTFSGDHVSGNTFNPPITGFIGEFEITYAVNLCSVTETITIGLDFNLNGQNGSVFCLDDGPFSLNPNIPGGTFSGEDIIGGAFAPSEAGQYALSYTAPGGCAISRTITIGPDFGIEGINTDAGGFNICAGSLPATLVGEPAGGTFSGPGFIAGQFNPAILPGSFNITYTLPGCGSVVHAITVEGVVETAIIDESNLSIQYCETDETVIVPVGNLASNADFFINGNLIQNFQPSDLGVGTYDLFYSFEDENGCTSLDVYTFNIFPIPNPDFDLPEEYCITEGAISLSVLTGVSGNSTFDGTGVSSAGSPIFEPSVAGLGTHSITHQIVDNIELCQAEMTKEITILPEVDASFEVLSLANCFRGEASLVYNGTSNKEDLSFTWSILDGDAVVMGGTGEFSDTAYVSKDISVGIENFTVELMVSNGGCTDVFQQVFEPNDLDVDILTLDQSVEEGSSVEIEALVSTSDTDNLSFEWSPSTGLSCTDCLNPIATPTESTVYSLNVKTRGICTIIDQISIEVSPNISETAVVIPSAFSPNEDSINDRFQVEGRNVESVTLQVYSRWGKKIFEGDGVTGWDGLYDLEFVENGVYVYVAQVVFLSGETVLKKGHVTVLR
ncbi:MAG: gliding motility-associated C-terminal domain-containing protein [Chitinophagales bacterium]